MNKKILSIAASLLLAVPMTVAAAPSPAKGVGVTDGNGNAIDGLQVIKEATSDESNPYLWVIPEENSAYESKIADSANKDFPKGFTIVASYEIDGNTLGKQKIENGAWITVSINVNPNFKVYHIKGNAVEPVEAKSVNGGISFFVKGGNLSPFIVVQEKVEGSSTSTPTPTPTSKATPGTSDSTGNVLWGSIAMISLACVAGLVVARKRNA
jgi:hypothetical protein